MEKHRKLAAIMFTDIAGYTALMSKDEENALRILQKNRDVIKLLVSQFNGEWLKEMGDGTLSSFGSVVDAVNCALEIQNTLRDEPDFKLRIGIHIGDVVVEEGDVFGDGVNVASRIEQLAEPGGICISDRVYYDIRNKPVLQVAFLGEKTLKNVGYPVKIYALSRGDSTSSMSKPSSAVESTAPKIRPSIAVLPFTNMSADPDQEYFCDGMAEEIINALAHVEGLLVVARNSTFAFKGQHPDIREVGRKLNVETVLEGSVRKAGDRLRITAQLINVADGYHLWSERYDRDMEDVFAIQDEISLAITGALKGKLLSAEKTALQKHYTENLKAYDLYLLGMHYFENEKGMKEIELFEQAIAMDPDFVLAYAGVALSYNRMGYFSDLTGISPDEAYTRAKEAAQKALAIDDTLTEAHAELAFSKIYYDWDWPGAEKLLLKALEIKPGFARTHHYYRDLLIITGRVDEALTEIRLALELDPISPFSYGALISTCIILERYDEAFEYSSKFQKLFPDVEAYYWMMGRIYYCQGRYGEALDMLYKYRDTSELYSRSYSLIGYAYAISGETDKALEIIREMKELVKSNKKVSPSSFAMVYSGLHDYDNAFKCLEEAADNHDALLLFMNCYPEFAPLRSDSRYKALLKRLGLPEK